MSQHFQNCPTYISMRAFIPRYPRRAWGGCGGTAAPRVHNALLWPSAAVFCRRAGCVFHKPALTFDLITHSLREWTKTFQKTGRCIIWASLCNAEPSWRQSGPQQTGSWSSGPLLSISPSPSAVIRLKCFICSAPMSTVRHNRGEVFVLNVCDSWQDLVSAQQMFHLDKHLWSFLPLIRILSYKTLLCEFLMFLKSLASSCLKSRPKLILMCLLVMF